MKLKQKIHIDFEEFFTTGKFDFLKLEKTKKWILNNFPDPDGFENNPEVFREDIWTYGNIELHFSNDELFLIFSDYIKELVGGNSLELKKWFLENTEKLKLSDVISELNNKHIDFRKKTTKVGHLSVVLELESGVNLRFALEENLDESYEDFHERCKLTNQDNYSLTSFSLMRK